LYTVGPFISTITMNMIVHFLGVILPLSVITNVPHSTQAYIHCSENEYFTRCVKDCPVGCDNIDNPPRCRSTGHCEPGCMCRQGFVRLHSRDPSSPCVTFRECLSNGGAGGGQHFNGGSGNFNNNPFNTGKNNFNSNENCAPEERWTQCKSECPASCATMTNPPYCGNSRCAPGCECRPGYYRLESNDPTSPCVTAEMCSQTFGGIGPMPGKPSSRIINSINLLFILFVHAIDRHHLQLPIGINAPTALPLWVLAKVVVDATLDIRAIGACAAEIWKATAKWKIAVRILEISLKKLLEHSCQIEMEYEKEPRVECFVHANLFCASQMATNNFQIYSTFPQSTNSPEQLIFTLTHLLPFVNSIINTTCILDRCKINS
ncbi:hypothetical protein T09_9538, partial [Trichinella sp. T9]